MDNIIKKHFEKWVKNIDYLIDLFCSTEDRNIKYMCFTQISILTCEILPNDRIPQEMMKYVSSESKDTNYLKFLLMLRHWIVHYNVVSEFDKLYLNKKIMKNKKDKWSKLFEHVYEKKKSFDIKILLSDWEEIDWYIMLDQNTETIYLKDVIKIKGNNSSDTKMALIIRMYRHCISAYIHKHQKEFHIKSWFIM